MKITPIVIALIAIFSLVTAACVTDQGEKQILGTLIGAAAGGLAGSQVGSGSGKLVAVGVGVLVGGWLGNEAGKSLDKADETYLARNAQSTLEGGRSYQTTRWRNPDTGNSGTFTPTRTFQTPAERPCREYRATVVIGGKTTYAYGTACRDSDGSWRVIN